MVLYRLLTEFEESEQEVMEEPILSGPTLMVSTLKSGDTAVINKRELTALRAPPVREAILLITDKTLS